MPKKSPEQADARREEIINACETLYRTKSFKEITIKEIGSLTDFTRTSIYNYFDTKEEIFLVLLQREYSLWVKSLEEICAENGAMSKDEFSSALAKSLEERPLLLKIVSMNHYDMEQFSRPERLTEFKKAYGNTFKAVDKCLGKFFPDMGEEDREGFIYAFFPFIFGIYAYTTVTEKQKTAMKKAGLDFKQMSVFELIYGCVKRLLD